MSPAAPERTGDTSGLLVLVGTPIGNLGDLSPRAVEALTTCDVVAAEDTRRSGRLLAHLGIEKPLLSYHDHNEAARTPAVLARVAAGEVVALVTDAGTPGLADPGFRLVRAAVDAGLPVAAVPGPAAALQALVLSGLPMDRFAFEGFLPRRPGPRRARLVELAADPRTLVLYLAPHRAAEELTALLGALGDRPAALARELTKLHEEVVRAPLSVLADHAAGGLRGEITLVVGGAPSGPEEVDDEELVARVRGLVATGVDRKAATKEVARGAEVPKRRVYQALLDVGSDTAKGPDDSE